MNLASQSYEVVPIDDLTIHPRNPRRGDVELLRESYTQNGFYGAVVVQRSTGYVLAGNHRVMAAREAGFRELPVIYVDVDDATATRILLVDNRAGDKAGYADDELVSLLRELEQEGDLSGTGWDNESLRDLERITGVLGKEAGSWLDELSGPPGKPGQQGHQFGRSFPEPGEEMHPEDGAHLGRADVPQYFSISYMYSYAERAEVLTVLNGIRDQRGLESAAAALLELCREYRQRPEFEPVARDTEE